MRPLTKISGKLVSEEPVPDPAPEASMRPLTKISGKWRNASKCRFSDCDPLQ